MEAKTSPAEYWPIVDSLPDGWVIDHRTGSPLFSHVFITNGKSPLNGQKRALMKVDANPVADKPPITPASIPAKPAEKKPLSALNLDANNPDPAYPKAVNDLARAQFKQKMLADVRADLMICELEGYSKREYIDELIDLLKSLLVNRAPKQTELFK